MNGHDASTDISSLEDTAARIPSMNTPFAKALLRDFAASAPNDAAIVEIGTWLGSGTAQLALGITERDQAVSIHSYDRFLADENESQRAAAGGLDIAPSSDTRPVVEGLLQHFPVEIHLHKLDLFDIRWENGPIGLYVDDAAKRPSAFYHMIETFAPFWIPSQTIIVLQDFNYWRKLSSPRSRRRYRVQRDFVERHPDCFTELKYDELAETSVAVFRYEKAFSLRRIRLKNGLRRLTRIGRRN
jgi:hypothetical protein